MNKFLHKTYIALLAMLALSASVASAAVPVDLTDAERAWIKAHPRIVLGTDASWTPYVRIGKDGVAHGLDPDYIALLNKKLGTRIELRTGKWADMVAAAKAYEIDGLATSAPLEERRTHFRFSNSYTNLSQYIIVHKDADFEVRKLQDLAGRKVAVQRGLAIYRKILREIGNIDIVDTDSRHESYNQLQQGKADAIIGDTSLLSQLAPDEIDQLKVAYVIKENPVHQVYSIRKDWPELLGIINKGLAAISQTKQDDIQAKWFNIASVMQEKPAAPQLELTPQEQAWLAEHPRLRMGFDAAYPPFDFIGEDGKHTGLSADYLKIISERLGISIEPVYGFSWTEVLETAERKEIDVISTLTKREERSQYLLFSKPFIKNNLTLVTRDDSPFITGLGDFSGKRVALGRGYGSTRPILEHYSKLVPHFFETPLEALQDVATGQVEGAVTHVPTAAYLIRKHNISNLKFAAPVDIEQPPMSIGVRKDWPELVGILNKALDSISEKERQAIRQKWIGLKYEEKIDYALIWKTVVGFSLLLLLVLLWNWQTRRQKLALKRAHDVLEERVQERTAELVETNAELSKEITERKEAEEALRESQSRHCEAQRIAHLGHWSLDLTSNNLGWSDEVYRIFEIDPEKLGASYKAFLDVVHPEDREFVDKSYSDSLKNKIPYDIEHRLLMKDGTVKSVNERCETFYDDDGNPLRSIGTVLDITDRKKAEEEKVSLEAQLIQAQKMETIGTLAGGIAHDFNNILSPILICTEVALDETEEGPVRDGLEVILKAVDRAKDLVRQILTFSREGEQEKRPLELQLIVREVVKLLRSTLPATIEIREEIDPDCDEVLADPTQIHQVLMNLCTNAYHAMQESGGVLEVRLFQEEIDDESAKSHIDLHPGGYVRLSVSDTGHGIDDVSLERIFDPFFTTKEEGKGTGLGLSVVHGIVASHNGTITVESEPGKGTSFHIYLPQADGSLQTEAERGDEINPKGRERLLFVDDEREIAFVAEKMLGRFGYDVTTKSCGVEALEEFRVDPKRYDVVITDHNMPKMTGLQLSRELIDIRPDIPVILTSGNLEADRLVEKEKSGIRESVMKPFSPNDLGKAIRRVLDEKGISK